MARKKTDDLPESVTLSAPHGFIDESGAHRHWQPGFQVTDPSEIALLIERRAPLDGIDYED